MRVSRQVAAAKRSLEGQRHHRSVTGLRHEPIVLQPPSTGKRVQWRLVMPGLAAMLQCETTAVNDHAITLRIDSISYRSPPGVTIR